MLDNLKEKIIDEELEEKIFEILQFENRSMSIKEITKILEERYEIRRSPQIVLRHLERLKKNRKIFEENGKKI